LSGLAIRHDESSGRFEADVDGEVAFVAYARDGEVLRLHHTEVPRAAEGRGIAGKMVKAALEYAETNRLRIDPRCSYVRGYMKRHPETQRLLAEGVTLD
jgi:predicted GNAT family acetyltransferase